LRKFLRWAVGLPIVLAVIAFAIANRQFVTLSLDPITPSDPFASVEMPLWLLFFLGILAGVVIGWIGCWFAQGRYRKRAREAQAEVTRLTAERDRLLSRQPQDVNQTPLVPGITPMGSGMGSGWI
jgi:uncharacterized integral membrane protein